MKKHFYIISFLLIALSSCELIVIGTPPQDVKPIEIDRYSGLGAALLFKEEIDTNNIQAAAEIFESQKPPLLRAIDRYDMYYELVATKNTLDDRSITAVSNDTLSEVEIDITLELNFTKKLKLKTFKKDSIWFISKMEID